MSQERKDFSQLDFGGVLKSAHDDKNKALRITNANTSVPSRYSRVVLTYNASDSVTNAKFYLGTLPEVRHITFTDDLAGSLNNQYFTLYTENDESLYHVWYNVSGTGVDPSPLNSCGIEVPIQANDPASIVKLATQRILEQFDEEFIVQELASTKIKIENRRLGTATDSVDSGTGFTIDTVQDGEETLLKNVDIEFDGKVKHVFNTQEKKFEVFPISDLSVTIEGEIDVEQPNTPQIINKVITTKNIEETQVLPNGTKRFTISVRDGRSNLRLAYDVGETTTAYRTIYRGSTWESNEIDIPDGTTLYLMSTQDNIVVEIEVWRRV
jgi:hypothetical protein